MSEEFFSGASANNTGRTDHMIPEGFYPALKLVKCTLERKPNLKNARCFVATLSVVDAANGAEAGELADMFEQVELNNYPSYDVQARGRVMKFLGTLLGLSKAADIDANVNSKVLEHATGPSQPLTGTIVAGRVKHVTTKAGKTIMKWEFEVPGGVAPATSPTIPAPAPTPADPSIPPGWAVHPSDARFIYEVARPANMKQIAA